MSIAYVEAVACPDPAMEKASVQEPELGALSCCRNMCGKTLDLCVWKFHDIHIHMHICMSSTWEQLACVPS